MEFVILLLIQCPIDAFAPRCPDTSGLKNKN